ncbi:Mut7-C ubiquitin/RNAse domain-containing protein [Halomonas campisalis]|uniref:Mut7-C ubiquitin/RNAse domain-containing protein n=1 Tax=Billgrantia campisalis TaxID=74661 RepID=A0ABS9P7A2_9GAMM|nr:Mut7-C ubiquitin/RNAse domain-containing protein [Halomonas campisalis]MCG6657476.1 Mut7-C ubiquitin/RNAse domain-containing protein [Halomonas campisalis]MDR5863178.1 Mut7-C ubiquitin/RNAse domain-containing protein [Halomonas campisalis]
MANADVHFHAELNDFLAPARRGRPMVYAVTRRAAIKDVIESLGVPHPEVDVILVDGASVGFGHILHGGERVDVYPWSVPVASAYHLRPRPPSPPRFVLDAHLGRLARYLRLLGFDCRYRNDYADDELAACADQEQRILLTRDRNLLKRKRIALAHFVRADAPWQQLKEVCAAFDLVDAFAPFTRCTRCNGRLEPVAKAAVEARLEPLTKRYVDDFLQCDSCHQVYWHGSHVTPMRRLVAALKRDAEHSPSTGAPPLSSR